MNEIKCASMINWTAPISFESLCVFLWLIWWSMCWQRKGRRFDFWGSHANNDINVWLKCFVSKNVWGMRKCLFSLAKQRFLIKQTTDINCVLLFLCAECKGIKMAKATRSVKSVIAFQSDWSGVSHSLNERGHLTDVRFSMSSRKEKELQ